MQVRTNAALSENGGVAEFPADPSEDVGVDAAAADDGQVAAVGEHRWFGADELGVGHLLAEGFAEWPEAVSVNQDRLTSALVPADGAGVRGC
jgi:hypothetical protein